MTDLPCLSIICPEGSEEVLGGAGEGCPFHFPGSPGGLAQAGGAGHFDRDEADDRGWYLWRGPRYGSPVDGPIPPGRRDSAGPKTPGSPPTPKLPGGQEAAVVALIEAHSPDQLGLPTSLWTRETVGILIKKRFGLAVSVWTVGRSLRRWGLRLPRNRPAGPRNRTLRRCVAGWKRDIRTSQNRPKRKGRRFTGVMRWEYAGTIRRGAPGAERERHRWSRVLVSASGATSSPP